MVRVAVGWLDVARLPTLETLLTSAEYLGLTTASPLQRAIARIADGQPLAELAAHPHVVAAIGDVTRLPRRKPRLLVILAGIRGGKSLLAAAGGVRAALTCRVDRFTAGERPRVPIVSVHKDIAAPTLDHLTGAFATQPAMRRLLETDPPRGDEIVIRHPTGRPIEIRVTAGARAGASLAARWLAAVIFDEAPRMVGAEEGVINLEHSLRTIAGRTLGPVWLIGSPWAPFGPVYELTREHEGKPSEECVVVRAKAPWLNPHYWTDARVAELRASSPVAYRTDVEAEFADPEGALIPQATVDACTRSEPLIIAPRPGHHYVAAIDPATRSNAWTLVVATRTDDRCVVVLARQWRGSPATPLDPEAVLEEIATVLRSYRVSLVESDQWSGDALAALARRYGLTLSPASEGSAEIYGMYLELARKMSLGEAEIPPDPLLRADLLRMQRVTTQTGVSVHLPLSADGRHCDYAPAVARVVRAYIREFSAPAKEADKETAGALKAMADRQRRKRTGEAPWKRGYGGFGT